MADFNSLPILAIPNVSPPKKIQEVVPELHINPERRGTARILNQTVRKSISLEKSTVDLAEKVAALKGICFSELVERALLDAARKAGVDATKGIR